MNMNVNTNVIVNRATQKTITSRLLASIAVTLLTALSLTASAKDIPGAAQTSYGVSSSGAFQFTIPIVVPAGRNGIQPDLSLNYSSSRSNGIAGVGWGVSGLSAITRCGKTIATNGVRGGVNHDNDDRFCLNGSQLIRTSGTYGAGGSEYRTEVDSFAKIEAVGNDSIDINGGTSPSGWIVWAKDGMKYFYGSPVAGMSFTSQFKIPGTSSIHAWNLTGVQDRAGNYYEVFYHSDNGRVDRIEYTKHAATNTGQVITFNYVDRPDKRFRYVMGERINDYDRLANITVTNQGAVFRKYELAYEQALTSDRSRLTSVTEYGQNNSAMPPIQIEWQSETEGFVNATDTHDIAPHTMLRNDLIQKYNLETKIWEQTTNEVNYGAWADVNGDGEVDQIIAVKLPNGTVLSKAYIRKNWGWDEQPAWRLPLPLRNYDDSMVNYANGRFMASHVKQGQLVDVDGDGLVDVVYSYYHYSDVGQSNAVPKTLVQETYLNTGTGFESVPNQTWKPKDILFDYVSNGYENGANMETIRGRLVDLNGDGLVDWVRAYSDYTGSGDHQPYIQTWINNGNGWSPDSDYNLPDVFARHCNLHSPLPHGQFVDLNGDGLLDWLQAYSASVAGSCDNRRENLNAWINTGTGWRPDNRYALPEPIYDNLAGWDDRSPNTRGTLIDVNGDGLKDWVRSWTVDNPAGYRVALINTGLGWEETPAYKPNFIQMDFSFTDRHRGWPLNTRGMYVDLNRDGLVDYVESYKSPVETSPGSKVYPVYKRAWLNTGNGWDEVANGSVYDPTQLMFDYSNQEKGGIRYGSYVDISSNGAADWVQTQSGVVSTRLNRVARADQLAKITTTMGFEVKPTFLPLTDNNNLYTKRPNKLSGGLAPEEAESFFVESPIYVTSKLQTSRPDSNTGYNTTSYKYGGLQVHRKGRGSQGFFQVTSTSELGVTTTTERKQAFPLTGRVTHAKSEQSDVTLSEVKNTYIADSTSRLGGKTYFPRLTLSETWSSEYNADQRYRKVERALTFDTYGSGQGDYGNVETDTTRVFSVHNNSNTLLHTTVTTPSYQTADITKWLISRLDNVTVTTDQTAALGQTAHTETLNSRFAYDVAGRLETVERESQAGDSTELLTQYTYNSTYGVLTGESVAGIASSRSSTISYDPDYRLPKKFINALGHEAEITSYHAVCDLPTTVEDANNLSTTITYDNFCRQVSVTDPAALTSKVIFETLPTDCGAYCQTDAAFKITNQSTTLGSDVQDVVTYLNRHGQAMASTTESMAANSPIWQTTSYNRYGLTTSETQPYFAGASEVFSATYSYDDLNRMTQVTLPYTDSGSTAATVDYGYGVDATTGWLTRTVTDQESRVTTSYANALGQIMRVSNALGHPMSYAYDSQSNLIQTTDAGPNGDGVNAVVTTIGYDKLGRRTSLNDPDLGLSTYTYTSFDELLTQTDAKGQVLTMSYDDLGRLTQREVNDGNTSLFTQFVFDVPNTSSTNAFTGKGALHKILSNLTNANNAGSGDHTVEFNYDTLGRSSEDLTYYGGKTYQEQYTYTTEDGFLQSRQYPTEITIDGQNNRTAVTAPFILNYHYQRGYLKSVSSSDNLDPLQCTDTHAQWEVNQYDAYGRVVDETLGQLVQTTSGFKDGQNVLESIQSVISNTSAPTHGTQVQNLSYQFDGVGNVTQRAGYLSGVTETFQYDELHRLKNYLHNAQSMVNLTYYANGNIKTKSDVGTYHYNMGAGAVRPHAVTRITQANPFPDLTHFDVNWEWKADTNPNADPGLNPQLFSSGSGNNEYTYDANGNITQSGNRYVTWTPFDKPKTMVRQTNTGYVGSELSYDGLFNRIKKVESTYTSGMTVIENKEITFYIGKGYEKISAPSNGSETHRYTVNVGHHTIQIDREGTSDFDKAKYMLADNLGSTNIILNAMGEVEQTLAFDPWGKRLNVDNTVINKLTNRGYTGHEMEDELGLINMNARIYDPMLGRFLSADPVLPDAGDMQQFNRYSYVGNNPMSFVDPSGNNRECPVSSFCPTIDDIIFTPGLGNGGGFGGIEVIGEPGIICVLGCDLTEPAGGTGGEPSGDAAGADTPADPPSVIDETVDQGLEHVREAGQILEQYGHVIKFPQGLILKGALEDALDTTEEVLQDVRDRNYEKAVLAAVLAAATRGIYRKAKKVLSSDKCFVAGTLVITSGGLKPIEEVQEGDLVASRNDETGETDWKPVVRLFKNHDKETLNIRFENSKGDNESIGVTLEHPFWVVEKGWVEAKDLLVGDVISTRDNEFVSVSSIASRSKSETTYNFEVGDFHTYYVGEFGLWVHNNCGDEKLVRFGDKPESAEDLAKQAADAEANGFPHGVSTKLTDKLKSSDKKHKVASRSDVEEKFTVEQTGGNKKHHTVHLPKPVTEKVAEIFNKLFKPKS